MAEQREAGDRPGPEVLPDVRQIGTRWPEQGLEVRSALIWSLGKAKPFQRRIQFAANYFPSLEIAAVPAGG